MGLGTSCRRSRRRRVRRKHPRDAVNTRRDDGHSHQGALQRDRHQCPHDSGRHLAGPAQDQGPRTSTSSTTRSQQEGIPAGTSGSQLILVVSGTVTNYTSDDPSCTAHAYTAGQGFIDTGSGDVHILRNESSTTPAETIAVQLLPQGAVRKTDAPAPGNCPF